MKWLIFALLLLPCFCFGQNLVPNPSFEDTVFCPPLGMMTATEYWFQPTQGTSDHFHPCVVFGNGVPSNVFGFQNPRTGEAYAGFLGWGSGNDREYIEVPLTNPLQSNRSYCVEFYVSNAEISEYAIDRIGAVFSTDSILMPGTTTLLYTPDVESPKGTFLTERVSWSLISGTYKAQGGEAFITIGNFYDNNNTDTLNIGGTAPAAYYYIDDVSVVKMDSIPAVLRPTTICLGDSTTLGSIDSAGYTYLWQGPGLSDSTSSMITVTPIQTTTYTLTINDIMPMAYSCQLSKTETVTITVIDCDTIPPATKNRVWLPNIFSPNGDGQNDVLYVRGNINELNFNIFNRWGEKVFESKALDKGWDGTFHNESMNDGVFVYYITGTYTDNTPFDIKGNVTLVR